MPVPVCTGERWREGGTERQIMDRGMSVSTNISDPQRPETVPSKPHSTTQIVQRVPVVIYVRKTCASLTCWVVTDEVPSGADERPWSGLSRPSICLLSVANLLWALRLKISPVKSQQMTAAASVTSRNSGSHAISAVQSSFSIATSGAQDSGCTATIGAQHWVER
jgi:hypothetical protein